MSASEYPPWERDMQAPDQTILWSVHASQFPELAHLYQTEQHPRCAQQVDALLKSKEDLLPDYYKAIYMLLLAICQPEDKHARIWNIQALSTFRVVVTNNSRTVKSQALLETLVFISMLVNVHLGGAEKQGGEPTQEMEADTKERLRAKSIRELGLETFMVHHALIVELQQWDAVEKVLYKHRRGREIRQAKEHFDHKVKRKSSYGRYNPSGRSMGQSQRSHLPANPHLLAHQVALVLAVSRLNESPAIRPYSQILREKLHDKRLGEEPRLKAPTRAHLTKPHHPLRNEVLASSVHDGKDKGKDAEAESSTHESAGNTPEVPPQTALNHAPESTNGLVHNPRNSKRLPSDSYNQGTKAKRQNYGLAQEIGVYRVQQKLLEMHHDATSKLASGKGKERSNDS
ncbi:hypothetical protein DL95DRAFT_412235 [Leptodontidium sp. 2 PMI_412]|nr:hypothetical protein DL95DRAFT_412235 [Leptodontidium sp. 2 PMI_412]